MVSVRSAANVSVFLQSVRSEKSNCMRRVATWFLCKKVLISPHQIFENRGECHEKILESGVSYRRGWNTRKNFHVHLLIFKKLVNSKIELRELILFSYLQTTSTFRI